MNEIFERDNDNVVVDDLRTTFSEMILYVETLNAKVGDEITDTLVERCRNDCRTYIAGRTDEVASSMKRLRTLVQRLEERVDAIENVKRHDPGHGQEDNEMARAGRALRQMRRNVYGTATTSPLPLDYEKRSPFMPRPAGVPLTPPHTQHPLSSNPLPPQQPHPSHPQHPLPINPLPPHPPAPNPPGAGDSPLPPLLNPALFRLPTNANVDVNVGQRHEPQTL